MSWAHEWRQIVYDIADDRNGLLQMRSGQTLPSALDDGSAVGPSVGEQLEEAQRRPPHPFPDGRDVRIAVLYTHLVHWMGGTRHLFEVARGLSGKRSQSIC